MKTGKPPSRSIFRAWIYDALMFWGIFSAATIMMFFFVSSITEGHLRQQFIQEIRQLSLLVALSLAPDEQTSESLLDTWQRQRGTLEKMIRAHQGLLNVLLVPGNSEGGHEPQPLRPLTVTLPPGWEETAQQATRDGFFHLNDLSFLSIEPLWVAPNRPMSFVAAHRIWGWKVGPGEAPPVVILLLDGRTWQSRFNFIAEARVGIVGIVILLATILSLLIRRRGLQREEAVQEKLAVLERLQQRDRVLACVASAADEMIRAPDFRSAAHRMLEILQGTLRLQTIVWWYLPGQASIGTNLTLWAPQDLNSPSWKPVRDRLVRGEIVSCQGSEVPGKQPLPHIHRIHWVPALSPGELAGVLLIAEDKGGPPLDPGVLDALRLAADTLSAAEVREKSEQRLRHASKMEALGRMAAGVAHEFNNLLHMIAGNLSRIRSYVTDKLNQSRELTDMTLRIEQATRRGTRIVEQLLRATRQSKVERKPGCLNTLIEQTLLLAEPILGASIQVEMKLEPHLPPVLMEEDPLRQVVLNLLINARDAMNGVGRLVLSTGLVKKNGVQGQTVEMVFARVDDTGPGMTAEVLEHLFDPFFTTKKPGEGTGLGLSTSQGILQQHDGLIEAFNRPEGGASFVFYLPVWEGNFSAPVSQPPEQSRPAPVPNRGRVLVADDEEMCRELLQIMLQEEGYEVVAVADGNELLEWLRKDARPVDWIITDWTMPGLCGRDLVNRILEERPGVSILVASGFLIESQCPAGVAGILHKPFDIRDLNALMSASSA